MSMMVSEITGFMIVYSIVCSGAYQRKHQRSTLLAFVSEYHTQRANNVQNVSIWWRHHVEAVLDNIMRNDTCNTK